MKIGILGGTFDPIHLGHLYIAGCALKEYDLESVWFMVAGKPYFKKNRDVTDSFVRFEMTKYTLLGIELPFFASDFEFSFPGPTYTALTLKSLKEKYPGEQFFFILGLDSLRSLKNWKEPGDILNNCILLCANRKSDQDIDKICLEEAHELSKFIPGSKPDIRAIHAGEIPISSSMIRERIKRGEDCSDLLHKRTYEFIRERGLYI